MGIVALERCPKNRKPRNTRPRLHFAADKWFEEKFGIRFRSNALFCTSCFTTALHYSDDVRHIYPAGEFQICWSPTIDDLYYYTMNRTPKEFTDFLDKADYQLGDLESALQSENEIMVYCETYYSCESKLQELEF